MSYQIHVVPYDSQWLERYAYEELGTRYADDRARYTESNSPFIQEMLEQARIWGGGKSMNHSPISTPSVHPGTGYSHATRVGNLLFVAGQIAKDKQGNLVGKGDIAAQAEQVFANLKAVLADAGCQMDDIVKLTTYTVDIRYRSVIAEVRARYCKEYLPPNTFLVVSSLADPDFLLEIDAVAALPD